MRRISLLLAVAAVILAALVGYTYKLRMETVQARRVAPAPPIKTGLEAVARGGWHEYKHDPRTNKIVVQVDAKGFQATKDPSTFELQDLALRLYNKDASSYTYIRTDRALFDERSGVMKSQDPVSIVIDVPADKNAADKDVA